MSVHASGHTLCISLSQRAQLLTLQLSHRQSRNSIGLSEQAPRPSPRHDSLGSDVLPRPLAASPPLFWFGCHRRREEPGSLRLRGPSPLPSTTAKPALAPKPGWNVHLLAHQLLLMRSVGTCPPSLPLWGNVRDSDGGVRVEIKNMCLDVRPVWFQLCPKQAV